MFWNLFSFFLNTFENEGKKQVMTFMFHVKELLLENNFQ
jgi:hypothetical protein